MSFSLPKIEFPSGNNAGIGLAAELLAPGTGIIAGSASQILAPETSDPGFFQNVGNSISNWFKPKPKPTGDPSTDPKENYADDSNKYLLIAVVVVVVIIIAFVVMSKKKPASAGS